MIGLITYTAPIALPSKTSEPLAIGRRVTLSDLPVLTTPLPPVPVIPVSLLGSSPVGSSLAEVLRASTMEAHQGAERKLRLPDSITSLFEYEKCLLRFNQLYLPLEKLLLEFPDWPMMGFESPGAHRSMWLTADLQALGVPANYRPVVKEASYLPALPAFANAVGALYVLEGSALGSQYILPPLQSLLGHQIRGADAFFRGRGEATGSHWSGFRVRLDEYGAAYPDQTSNVIAGAIATFESIGNWLRP